MIDARRGRAAGFPGLRITVLLLAVLVTVNAVAVWGILSARAGAQRAAREELALQTTAHARALEAVLATLRGDFIFLSQSPALLKYLAALKGDDETQRRWARLDVDSTLLLFVEAHPPVERIVVRDDLGEALAVVGRRSSVPVLLPRASFTERVTGVGRRLLAGRWPLGAIEPPAAVPGTLEAWISPDALLAMAAPGLGDRLRLETGRAAAAGDRAGALAARVAVRDPGWTPPVAWTLVRSEPGSELVQSVETLAGRYRTTVLLNLAVITLTLTLGLLAFRQVRRAARLEVENEQQARVRELERQLMHSERLASVGRLAAGMAHEINNPLAGMSNYLSLLEEDLRDGRTAEAPALVARVREGLARAAAIVRQVLAFSDPGRAPKAPLDLRDVLVDTLEFVRGNPAFRSIAVRLEGDEEGPLPVLGNRITLGQLFLNLILNACQSQPDGGEVEVRAERGEDGVTVAVADRGPGLAPEVLAHLFEPFTSTRGSSGLGLAVCHGIVSDHGGAIEGANRADGGALFTVRLPLAAAGAAGEATPAAAPRRAAGGRR